eukprot:COSAG04_NODE_14240_length_576_cov_0.725367_1_plen_76_part_10
MLDTTLLAALSTATLSAMVVRPGGRTRMARMGGLCTSTAALAGRAPPGSARPPPSVSCLLSPVLRSALSAAAGHTA